MSDDEEMFRDLMGDVKPHKSARRVALKNSETDPSLEAKRKAAAEEEAENRDTLSGDFIEALAPDAILDFKRPGVQNGVYRNLRLGKYDIDARLDMHGLTVEQARISLVGFVDDCIKHDIRCVLITHGKGIDRKPQPALLKSCVAHWLPQLDAVMAFHSAQKHHGGVGATYVMIRKSDKKRLENQRIHTRRKGG